MKKIIIIGGGIAGLSAGCYAKMNGYDTEIFEMHSLPGGLCTAWERKGYTFDFCIQWLFGTSPDSPFHKIWRELGAIQNKEVYYNRMPWKIHLKDHVINFYNDSDRLAKYLKEISPEDSSMIDELIDCINKFSVINKIPLQKPKELFNIIDIVKMIIYMLPIMKLVKKYGKTTINEFASMFKSPVLRQAIQYTEVSFGSDDYFAIPFVLANRHSGFPKGGSLSFARSIEQRYKDLGGRIQYNSKIKKILIENSKAVGIVLEDGREAKADIVISAADGYSTILKMLESKFINKKIRHLYEHEAVTPSLVQVSLGVDMKLSGEQALTEYLYELKEPITIAGKENKCILVRYYAFDPTFAPLGKSTLTVALPSESTYWEEIYSDKEKYKQEKKRIEEAVVSSLETIVPGIEEKIEVVNVATPMTIIRYTNNWKGSIMAFAKGPFLNIPRRLPKLLNFFMVGQWVGDSGVSGAAKSGRDILEYICKKDKKRFITTEP
ncbi:MAG: NAD(P)/FAD-dependent oxidoreductase [Atribacterota bacterium]